MTTGIVITAAGRGERFIQAGGSGNKLNALLQGKTVFEQTLQQALASGLPVQVVTRPENLPVQQACAAHQVPCTLLASGGLGESIAAGVAATASWDGWLIHWRICRLSRRRFLRTGSRSPEPTQYRSPQFPAPSRPPGGLHRHFAQTTVCAAWR